MQGATQAGQLFHKDLIEWRVGQGSGAAAQFFCALGQFPNSGLSGAWRLGASGVTHPLNFKRAKRQKRGVTCGAQILARAVLCAASRQREGQDQQKGRDISHDLAIARQSAWV